MDFKNINGLQNIDFGIDSSFMQDIQKSQDEQMKSIRDAADRRNRKFEETRQAAIETAENTAEMKGDLKTVIHNQNSYIKLLEGQNELLKNLFVSGEDGVMVQKEIMQIMKQQGNDNVFIDKALDTGVGAVMLAVQIWLKKHGVDF